MKQYELDQMVYEAENQFYENVMEDCFGGLQKLFAASYPNHTDEDLTEIFAVIAWELCKAKAEIERMKHLHDPDRVPSNFIEPLAHFYGIDEFPTRAYPEEKRRYLAYAYEIQKYKGTQYGLELMLKSLMPFDTFKLFPMYRRGLRTYYRNNDYTGGRMAGNPDPVFQDQLTAGYPLDWRIAGPNTFPTGIIIGLEIRGARTERVIEGLLGRIRPLIEAYMPENAFYNVKLINPVFGENEVTFQGDNLMIGDETIEF